MKNFYLAAAVVGTVIPYFFFIQHFAANGYSLIVFLKEIFGNPAASGGTSDLFISSFVFWIYMFSRGSDAPRPWPFIVLNLCIGLSCALPLYLYQVERQAEQAK